MIGFNLIFLTMASTTVKKAEHSDLKLEDIAYNIVECEGQCRSITLRSKKYEEFQELCKPSGFWVDNKTRARVTFHYNREVICYIKAGEKRGFIVVCGDDDFLDFALVQA